MSKPKKRLADCSVLCNGSQLDFNVWPRRGESNAEACLRKARQISKGTPCETLRARSIDGIGKAGTRFTLPMRVMDRFMGDTRVTAAAARALRICRAAANKDCQDACRSGILALEREIKKPSLSGRSRVRIIRED